MELHAIGVMLMLPLTLRRQMKNRKGQANAMTRSSDAFRLNTDKAKTK